MGLDMVPESTQNDLNIDLPDPPSDWSRDGLQMTSRLIPRSDPQKQVIFNTLLTVGELKDVPSKDWIAPPTCFEK